MPLLDHFGLLAPYYDRAIGEHNVELLSKLLGLPTHGMLLDAGGGTGRVARSLLNRVSGVVIYDESQPMLAQALKKGRLPLVSGQTEQLPFADDTFVCVMMIDALHHVADQRATLAELWRVLQPGGRLVVEEPDISRWAIKLLALAEKVALMRTRIISPERIAATLSDVSIKKQTPQAQIRIEREGLIAFVTATKAVG